MKTVRWAILALMVCACGKNSDDSALPQSDVKDITDRSTCNGTPPANATIFSTWHSKEAVGQIEVDTTVQVQANTATFTNTCIWPNHESVSVSLTLNSQVNGNQFTIIQGGENSAQDTVGDTIYQCDLNEPAITLTFGFVGNCLTVTPPNSTTVGYMTP